VVGTSYKMQTVSPVFLFFLHVQQNCNACRGYVRYPWQFDGTHAWFLLWGSWSWLGKSVLHAQTIYRLKRFTHKDSWQNIPSRKYSDKKT
jgi:hypothetical protein